jgi:hypothetical protein
MNKPIHIKQAERDSWMNSLWASSIILARFILKNDITIYDNLIDNRTNSRLLCLELGSGFGLVSIALLTKNFNVIATEKESVISTLENNLRQFINTDDFNIRSSYKVEHLDWSSFDNDKTNNETNRVSRGLRNERRQFRSPTGDNAIYSESKFSDSIDSRAGNQREQRDRSSRKGYDSIRDNDESPNPQARSFNRYQRR